MVEHTHKFVIADDEAVHTLVGKLMRGDIHEIRDERLLRALEDASGRYENSNQEVRRAFFHGLLTGYAVALKLR
jgi:hypothetical protein